MQRILFTALLSVASLFVLPMTTMAQETMETETGSGVMVETSGSGRTLTEVLATIESMIIKPKDTSSAAIAVDAKLLQEWKTEALRIRERQRQNRSDCAGAIRRANRDTLMEIATRCIRNDLLQETTFLRKQQEVLDATPLRNEMVRPKVQEAMTAFTDASTAILNAIDAGLFSQIKTLRQAVRNLHGQYRQAMHQPLTLLRWERERTWMLHVTNRMTALQEADPAADVLLTPVALCLEDAAALFSSSQDANDSMEQSNRLQAVRTKNSACRIMMQQAISSARASKKPLE